MWPIQQRQPPTVTSPDDRIHSPPPPPPQPQHSDDEDDYFGGTDDFQGLGDTQPDPDHDDDLASALRNLGRCSLNQEATANESMGCKWNVEFHPQINGEFPTFITNQIHVLIPDAGRLPL